MLTQYLLGLARSFLRFRLLTEYRSFLYYVLADNNFVKGVFPSPYGVSFILIAIKTGVNNVTGMVSVSLRSIVHSYPMVKKVFYCNNLLECYRMIFLFLNFFCLFQLKASLTPLFLNIV